jgi:hypothetical protein
MTRNKSLDEQLDEDQKINPSWSPNENEKLVGVLKCKKTGIGKYSKNVFDIELDGNHEVTVTDIDGNTTTIEKGIVSVWGSTVIDNKIMPAELGSVVGLKYLGRVEGEKQTYHNYNVIVEMQDD